MYKKVVVNENIFHTLNDVQVIILKLLEENDFISPYASLSIQILYEFTAYLEQVSTFEWYKKLGVGITLLHT